MGRANRPHLTTTKPRNRSLFSSSIWILGQPTTASCAIGATLDCSLSGWGELSLGVLALVARRSDLCRAAPASGRHCLARKMLICLTRKTRPREASAQCWRDSRTWKPKGGETFNFETFRLVARPGRERAISILFVCLPREQKAAGRASESDRRPRKPAAAKFFFFSFCLFSLFIWALK